MVGLKHFIDESASVNILHPRCMEKRRLGNLIFFFKKLKVE